MADVHAELWREASPHLDEGLALSGEERRAWLATLRASRPELAEFVEGLLEEHRRATQEGFLERPPALPYAAAADARQGQSVGAYTLLAPAGEGGMGSVWLAERTDGRFERRVAVKFLRFALGAHRVVERFAQEGRILGQLTHPHIAELIDAGVTPGGEPYLVLEFVEGAPIDEYCDRHALGLEARVRLFLDVLEAVAAAHAQLVVHRDIKPSNVLVREDGQVKLLDFGIAKLLRDADGANAVTLAGGAALTPRFAAPEQLTGEPITTATDVYALGVLLYLLLTGHHPAGAETQSTAALVRAIVEVEPPRASETVKPTEVEAARKRDSSPDKLRRNLRGDLDLIVGKALRKARRERYASVAELGEDLRRYLRHEPIGARPDALAYRLGKYVRRHRIGVAAAAGFVLLLTGFSAIQAIALQRITRERDRASRIAGFMTSIFKISDPNEHTGQAVTARALLDNAAKTINSTLGGDPTLRAQMLHVMGRAYLDIGLFSRAEALFREGIAASRSAGGQDSRDTLRMTHDLAWAVLQQGRTAEAEGIERKLLAIQRRVLGPEHGDTLATMEELAFTICNTGKRECGEGIRLVRHVLAQHERTAGPDAYYTLVDMDNLAIMLATNGQLAQAIAVEQDSLQRHLRRFGPENIGTVNAMLDLGEFQRDAGEEDAAEAMLRHLLSIERRAFAPDQGETAGTEYDLASVLLRQGHKGRAMTMLRAALASDLPPRIAQGLPSDPLFASLHADPQFQGLVAAVRQRFPSPARPAVH
jgi:serine/threonine protein kinase